MVLAFSVQLLIARLVGPRIPARLVTSDFYLQIVDQIVILAPSTNAPTAIQQECAAHALVGIYPIQIKILASRAQYRAVNSVMRLINAINVLLDIP